jgi:hypothetical protein
LEGGAVCEHVADLALDACPGAHVPQSLVGRVAGVRGLLDRTAAGALAFEDLVHQLTAVLQAIGVAEQPGPARPAILAVPVPIEVMAMARAGGADGC